MGGMLFGVVSFADGGGAVEVRLEDGPEVVGDLAALFEAHFVVGSDVVSPPEAGDGCHFGDGGKGGELEGDPACLGSGESFAGLAFDGLH